MSALQQALTALGGHRVIQLGLVIDGAAAKNPSAPAFSQALYELHEPGRTIIPGQIEGVSSATDIISMSTHSGTHMDSLSHIGHDGVLFDGTPVDGPGVQEPSGVRLSTRENFSPIFSRGILLDFARLLGVERVPQDFVITEAELDRALDARGITLQPGDTVLFRTGWDTLSADNEAYTLMPIPGPDADVARRLVREGVVATGSDTMPYEAAPGDTPLEVHVILLPQAGVFIFEMMDLRELAAEDVARFLFIAAPLRLRGGTGSPINPLAVLVD